METIKDIKELYVHHVGELFTEFVHDNYEHLEKNWQKVPKRIKDKMLFPVFCYAIFSNVITPLHEKKTD